jgi:hypothetical protein
VRSRTIGVVAALLAAAVSSGCQNTDKSASPEINPTPAATHAETTEPAVTSGTPTTVASATSTATAAGASDTTFVMPNEVGKVLQDPQDDIQQVSGNPIFITRSVDATGRGRHQILDRDW